jgi:hypothetical protein
LRVEIARGRSCASVLVVPRRKMTMGRALHGRAAMAGVGAPWPAMGSSSERGKRGKEEGSRGRRCVAPWGGKGVMGRGAELASRGLTVAIARSLLVVNAVVRAVREGEEEKEEREKKRKGRKRKEKKRKEKKRKEKI